MRLGHLKWSPRIKQSKLASLLNKKLSDWLLKLLRRLPLRTRLPKRKP